jgi:hypothetical protein
MVWGINAKKGGLNSCSVAPAGATEDRGNEGP